MRRYIENQYGVTASPLHGGLPTDRCIAEWWIDSPRVQRDAGGRPAARRADRGAHRVSRRYRAHPREETATRAREIQRPIGEQFPERLRAGAGRDRLRAQRERRSLSAGAMAMKLDRITLRQIRMPLVHFFETSFCAHLRARHRSGGGAVADGVSGWGEVTAGENPFYNEEWTDSAWLILRDYVAPRVLGRELAVAEDVCAADRAHSRPQHGARRTRGGGVGPGGAPATACRCGSRSAAARGARFRAAFRSAFRIPCEQLLEKIETELAAGYQRIKMKIKPGWDVDVVRAGARALSRRSS